MKYGVVLHKETKNFGDDVQAYAQAKLLPQIDYYIDREHIDTFKSENNEPVAVIMAAWWFWQKWNWPPAECIYPLMVSMHLNNYNIYNRGTPVLDSWMDGIGGDYLRAYGPVGVRDQSSLDLLKAKGIDAYFSGCITTTLPKQPKTENCGKYICLVDLNEKLSKKAHELLDGKGYEIVELSHNIKDDQSSLSMEERFKEVEKYLTIYQNAHCVITRRLHVTLPCVAMDVPVFSVVTLEEEGNKTRWYPFVEHLHVVTYDQFLADEYEYDFMNPPENKPGIKKIREDLLNRVKEFLAECEENKDKTAEELKKTSYTAKEAKEWQHTLMKNTLEKWLHQSRGMMKKYNNAKKASANVKKDTPQQAIQQTAPETTANRMKTYLRKMKKYAKKAIGK